MKFVFATEPLTAVDQSNLSERVYERLKVAILNGNFAFGERLPSDELAKLFQVSAMPVRDALKLLEADGLVNIVPRRGAFVTEVDPNDVREIFQIRRMIECAAVGYVENLSEALIEQLYRTQQEMESLRDGQTYIEYPRYVQLDAQFHNLLVDIASNRRLTQIYQGLHWPIQLVLVLSHSDYQRAKQTGNEHQEILDALSAKNVEEAQRAITTHLQNAEMDLLRRLPEVPD